MENDILNRQNSIQEYLDLRKEILQIMEHSFKSKMVLITSLWAFFTYLIIQPNPEPIAFLIPMPFIIIFYILNQNNNYERWKISTYFQIFYNECGIEWQKRIYCFRKINDNKNKGEKEKKKKENFDIMKYIIKQDSFYVEICIIFCLTSLCFEINSINNKYNFCNNDFKYFIEILKKTNFYIVIKSLFIIVLTIITPFIFKYIDNNGRAKYPETIEEMLQTWKKVKNKEKV